MTLGTCFHVYATRVVLFSCLCLVAIVGVSILSDDIVNEEDYSFIVSLVRDGMPHSFTAVSQCIVRCCHRSRTASLFGHSVARFSHSSRGAGSQATTSPMLKTPVLLGRRNHLSHNIIHMAFNMTMLGCAAKFVGIMCVAVGGWCSKTIGAPPSTLIIASL